MREKAGLEDVRIHDLRRTVGSWMAQAGVPIRVIGEVLNHSDPRTTEIYARLARDQASEALDSLGETIADLLQLPGLGKTQG